ncbi:MAG: serine protease [Alphaproteobacteria bacterium]|nr:serine protease [Alphaproteobacteria bacterium]
MSFFQSASKVLLATLVCLGLLASGAKAQDRISTVAAMEKGTVGIGTFDPVRRPQNELLGAGFAVGDGRHIITAAHVINARDVASESRAAYLAVFAGRGEDATIRRATIAFEDPGNDVAVVRIDGQPVHTLSLASSDEMQPAGAEVLFTGYPIGAVYGLYPATHRGMIAGISPIARPAVSARGLSAEAIRRIDQQLVAYQLDATSYPGNSGGPLVDPASGRVIGLINSTFVQATKESALERPSGVTFAIPVEHLRAALRQAGQL